MNRRTLLLLIGALAIGGIYGMDQLYRSFYERPIEQLNTRLDGLVSREKKVRSTALEARENLKRLEVYTELSLPYDVEQARAAYHQWLLSLVGKYKMTQSSVDPAPPRTIEVRNRTRRGSRAVATRFPFQLRARTNLAAMTQFMDEFMQAGHLHKITSMTLNPAGSELDITLSIEALSIDDCERESELSTQRWERSPTAIAEWSVISRRNLFARGFSQGLLQTRLTAITYGADGEAEAWFRVASPAGTQQVRAGDRLDIELFTVEVIDILPDRAFVRVDGASGWLAIGKPLSEVAPAEAVSQPNADPVGGSDEVNGGPDGADE